MKIAFQILFITVLVYNSIMPLFSQGNYRLENFGNRSVLLSGVVTGTVEDLGLTYYNPSRLALVPSTAFTINAQSYQLNQVEFKNAFGNNQKLNNTKFRAKPSMVAGTFRIKFLEGHHFAYAFISKARREFEINYSTAVVENNFYDQSGDLESSLGEVSLSNKIDDDWYGLTWSKLLSENFSIGVSTFLSVYRYEGSNYLTIANLDEEENVALYNEDIWFRQDSYGLFWKLGLSWRNDKLDLGLNISLPYLEIIGNGSFAYKELLSGFESFDDIFISNKFEEIEAQRKEPLSIAFGAGIPIGKSKIHLNVEWYNKISSYDRLVIPELDSEAGDVPSFEFKEDLHTVVNYGVGVEIYVSPTVSTYVSFTSDYSPSNTNANIFDLINEDEKDVNLIIDYFHFGLGISAKFKKFNMVFGSTYSSGDSSFDNPINLPSQEFNSSEGEDASIRLTRLGFLVGLEIPIFNINVE